LVQLFHPLVETHRVCFFQAQLVANPLPQVEEEAEAGKGSSLRINGDIREGPDNGGSWNGWIGGRK